MPNKSLWTDRPDFWPDAPEEAPRAAATPVSAARPARAARRRRVRPAAAVACALALGGVGTGGYLLGTSDETPPASAAALPAAAGRLAATSINDIYARAGEAVVSVQASGASSGGAASGTGFLIDADGTIVTNAHVVGGADRVRVAFDDDAAPVDARLVGSDPSTDLAVLHVDPSDARGVTPLALAESGSVQVGDAAIAIGFPLGLDRTATAGIVSGVGREIEAPNGFSIDDVIQTDAPINPGNSGGPLLDAQGRVIGVNSQIATAGAGGGNVGIGFAVPSDTVREIVPKLKAGQSVERAWLGVATAEAGTGAGEVRVASVNPGGPAQEAGLRAGDTLVSVDGREITGADDVADAVQGHEPGDSIEIELTRGGATMTVEAVLGTRPEATP